MGCSSEPPKCSRPRPEAMSLTGQPPEAITAPTRMATHAAAVSIVVLVERPAMSSRAERMGRGEAESASLAYPVLHETERSGGFGPPPGRIFGRAGSVAARVADHEGRR